MRTTSDLLREVLAIRHAAQSLLLHATQLEKDLMEAVRDVKEKQETTQTTENAPVVTAEDPDACPVKCARTSRINVGVMGHPNRTQCRMCSRVYES